MEQVFFDITVLISLAAALTIIFRLLKQPPILAYILTGIILGPLGLFHLESSEALTSLGQLGITLLLFMLGLEMKLGELRSIGKSAVIVGSLQVISTFLGGYVIGQLLGFSAQIALYLGIALSFSSTIIIVKMLSDKKELTSLHGKLAIGILLMQDFFAVMTIVFLSNDIGSSGPDVISQIGVILLKVFVLFGWITLLGVYVFPKIIHKISRSSESLFLFSLAWVFILTAFVSSPFIGFSVEIGGFLAGLALANAKENFQIVARMKALRDFFITIFFVLLGLEMKVDNIGAVLIPSIILILFVIFVKPFLIMGITGLLGHTKRTSFLVGSSLAQISEFSFIILFLGNQKGIVPSEVVTMVLLVGITSFGVSTYYMQRSKSLYRSMAKYLDFLERKHLKRKRKEAIEEDKQMKDHIVLIGAHEMGQSILHALRGAKEEVVIVDFDPDVINSFKKKGLKVIFGDIADPDIQERVGIEGAKLIISTIPDLESNLLLVQATQHANKKAKIMMMAYEIEDAKVLYNAGADYVIMPHIAGGNHIAKILIEGKNLELIEKYREKDLMYFG